VTGRRLVRSSNRSDTDLVNTIARSAAVAGTIVVIAGACWLGLKQHERHEWRLSRIACEEKDQALNRQIESIRQAAHQHMKIGSKKADVYRFFAEQGIPFDVSNSEAFGTLHTTGCAPAHCGDGVLLGVRVKLDQAEIVTEEPTVETMFDDCP
jgi:hypothetical protein